MRRYVRLIVGLSLVLFFGVSVANAKVTVLKATSFIGVSYEFEDNRWEKDSFTDDEGESYFLVIDVDDSQSGHYQVNYLEVINVWNDEDEKGYDRTIVADYPYSALTLVDLGKNDKIALTADIKSSESSALAIWKGKINKEGYIKFLKGFWNYVEYNPGSGSPDLTYMESVQVVFKRTKKFDAPGKSGSEIAEDIVTYLENKGFIEEW